MLYRNFVVFMLLALTTCTVGCGILDSGTCKDGNNDISNVEVSDDRITLTVSDTVYGPALVHFSVRGRSGLIDLHTFNVEDGDKVREFTLLTPADLSGILPTSTSDYLALVACSN